MPGRGIHTVKGRLLVALSCALCLLIATGTQAAAGALEALSSRDAAAGLKSALAQSAAKAVQQLGASGGFLQDARVTIPLPAAFRKVDSALRMLGLGGDADALKADLNHAAEEAVSGALPVLKKSLRNMTLADAKSIVAGGEDSATNYFRGAAGDELRAAFKPIVARVTAKNPIASDITFVAGVLFFPLSYIFGDILTEVYGYARDRRCVWAGFAALAFAAFMAWVIVALPPAAEWRDKQATVAAIFGNTWRIVGASIIAFWSGSLVNSYVLAKMKIHTRGRWLWTRIIRFTICGEAVQSGLFYSLAFYGLWEPQLQLKVMVTQYVLKTAWEAVMTPVTYRVVAFLKRSEQEDYYDTNTDFTPFSLRA